MKATHRQTALILMFLVLTIAAGATVAPAEDLEIYQVPVVNYDLNGNQIWSQQLASGLMCFEIDSHSIAVSNAEVITVLDAGFSMTPALTRLNRDGQVVWQQALDFDYGELLCNSDGDCFVFGTREGDENTAHTVAKYDTNGDLSWQVSLDIEPGWGAIHSLDFDSAGNVLVNYSNGDPETTITNANLLLLDANGNQFAERHIAREDADVVLEDAQFTADGSVIATGYTTVEGMGTDDNFFAAKFDNMLEQLWLDEIPHEEDYSPAGLHLAEDPEGDIVVLAHSLSDALLLKYDADGNLLWNTPYDSSHSPGFTPLGFVLDANNAVLILGWDFIDSEAGKSGSLLSYVLKIDTAGAVEWFYETNVAGAYYAQDLTVDAAGNSYLVGYSISGDEYNLFTMGIGSGGDELWSAGSVAELVTTSAKAADPSAPALVVAYPHQIALLPGVADDDATDDDATDDDAADDDATDDDGNDAGDDDDDDNGCGS